MDAGNTEEYAGHDLFRGYAHARGNGTTQLGLGCVGVESVLDTLSDFSQFLLRRRAEFRRRLIRVQTHREVALHRNVGAQFKELGAEGIRAFGKPDSLVYDIKYVLPQDAADDRL